MARKIDVAKDQLVARLKKEGKSYRQIAKLINVDVKTVFTRHKRALALSTV